MLQGSPPTLCVFADHRHSVGVVIAYLNSEVAHASARELPFCVISPCQITPNHFSGQHMTIVLMPDELKKRADAINLTIPRLFRLAGVNVSAWSKWKSGAAKPYVGTLERLSQALVTDELRLHDHLVELHGFGSQERDAA